MSLPIHHPEKWNGMKVVPEPTRSVTCALTLICAPVGVFTHTYSPSFTPRSLASLGLISTKFSCCNSASQAFERVSSPPPSYSTSRPLVRMSGNFSAILSSTFFCCTDLNNVGNRQNALLSSCVGYLATRSGRGEYNGSRCCGMPSGKFQTIARALALPQKCTPCFIVTRWMPPERSVFQFLPSAAFFSASVSSSHHPSFFIKTWSNSG